MSQVFGITIACLLKLTPGINKPELKELVRMSIGLAM